MTSAAYTCRSGLRLKYHIVHFQSPSVWPQLLYPLLAYMARSSYWIQSGAKLCLGYLRMVTHDNAWIHFAHFTHYCSSCPQTFHLPSQFSLDVPWYKKVIIQPCTMGQIHYFLIFGTVIPYLDECGQSNLQHDVNKFRFKIYRPREWKLEGGETNSRACRMMVPRSAGTLYPQFIIDPDA